ncbi:Uncharacterized protein SCF082_LOCUS44573 [Durusdinium trenchii]|uniref:CRAL-TRIO domain-containing protein n=1 Tax=Durusdinium trenchii TaxID=1381693 RepID=A0ABP0R2Q6_9DINO
MSFTFDGADCSWPSPEELAKVQEIREKCAAELAALSESPRDVVGDIRVARFLRFYGGKVPEASKGFSDFLKWRVKENIDVLRKGIIDLNREQFHEWVDSVRSPFAPVLVPFFGETQEGHIVIFVSPGYFKAAEFVSKRPACHTMDNDLMLARAGIEYVMKVVDDNCHERHQMLYTVKVIDATHLGRETLPIFVPEVRKFAQDNMKQIMEHYCDQDILILLVNAPFIVRLVLAFATTFMARRQSNRIRVFSSATGTEIQKILRAIGPPTMFPESLAGTRKAEDIPFYFPLAQNDEKRIKEWMSRTASGITRGGATNLQGLQGVQVAPPEDATATPMAPVTPEASPASPIINTEMEEDAKKNSAMTEVKPAVELDEQPAPAELAALPQSPRDVVGDIRIARFLRYCGGKVPEAATGFAEFLKWRVQEKVDVLRQGIIDLKPDEFIAWVDSVRSPFAPVFVPFLGQSKEGHIVIFAAPGYFKATQFVNKRPACHTMENDLMLARAGVEYMMKLVDDNSYERHQMLYSIKVIDAAHLGRETLPIFVPEIRKFAQENEKQMMDMYCDQDILILVLNASLIVRAVLAFATTFMAKQQSNRIKVFASATGKEAQKTLRAVGPLSMFPESLGGTRKAEDIPFYFPLAQDDEKRIEEWMSRTTSGITRHGATSPPGTSPASDGELTWQMQGKRTEAEGEKEIQLDEPAPSGGLLCCSMNAANFTTFSTGIGSHGFVLSQKYLHDYPSEFYRMQGMGLMKQLPKNTADKELDKPAYVFDVKYSMSASIIAETMNPRLGQLTRNDPEYKFRMYHAAHPTDYYLEQCMADWDNYQKMFKEQGCEREYVKYPYTRDMIEGYFKEYCAMTGLSVSADGPAPNAPPLTDCLETVLGALPAWAEDKRNLEGMDQNLLKDRGWWSQRSNGHELFRQSEVPPDELSHQLALGS